MSALSTAQTDCPVSKSCSSVSAQVTLSHNGSVVNSQGLALSPVSDLSLVEMTEVEYTHLQHIIYSQMDAPPAEQDGTGAGGLGLAYEVSGPTVQTSHHIGQIRDEGEYEAETHDPTAARSCRAQSPDGQYTNSSNDSSRQDLAEIKMILVGDAVTDVQMLEGTPTGCGEVPGPVLAKARSVSVACAEGGAEPRPNPAARVRLEKRFGCVPSEVPRLQISSEQPATFTNFLSMLHHPTDLFGVTVASEPTKCAKVGQSRMGTSGCEFSCAYPAHGGSVCSSVSGLAQNQKLSGISHILESVKHHNMIFPRNVSLGYQQDAQPAKAAFGDQVKSESEVWIKLEGEGQQKAVLPIRRARARGRQVCPERHALSDIRNACGVGEAATASGRKAVPRCGAMGDSLQRRERHNSMERDRRRRIRICCDELNMLVPFCNLETDKATTLQWTTAFLKYIKEIHGDSLKQEFQKVFCGQTGKRIKLKHASEPAMVYGESISVDNTLSDEQN